MKIEVEKHYLTAKGQIIYIDEFDNGLYWDITGNLGFFEDGIYDANYEYESSLRDDLRLIAEIPEKLHKEIIRVINEYHTNPKFRNIIEK